MAADAPAHFVARSSAAKVLIMLAKQVLVFHEKWIQVPAGAISLLRNDRKCENIFGKCKYIFVFPKICGQLNSLIGVCHASAHYEQAVIEYHFHIACLHLL